MVGHDITAKRRRDVSALTAKTEKAADRASKAANMAMTRKEKQKVLPGAVIPATASETLWDIPSNKAMARLRTSIPNAVGGRGGRLRCPEIVLGVIDDPTNIAPLSRSCQQSTK